jgi:hypothetical protein
VFSRQFRDLPTGLVFLQNAYDLVLAEAPFLHIAGPLRRYRRDVRLVKFFEGRSFFQQGLEVAWRENVSF